ncbi:MAG: hypothetical protein GTO40_12210 [Deltaproteobacteria bacterium]|nr:hypothetical protein [Deltaproteobacteria bacterium]
MNFAIGLADSNTKVIPGHGVISNKDGMIEFRNMLKTIDDRVRNLINQGKSLEEVLAAKPTADYDARWGKTRFFTEDKLVTLIYEEQKGR